LRVKDNRSGIIDDKIEVFDKYGVGRFLQHGVTTQATNLCMGRVYRTKGESLPKKMLGAWVPATRKAGRPQMSSKDNFIPHSQRSSKQPNQ